MSSAAPLFLTQAETDLLAGALGMAVHATGGEPQTGALGSYLFVRAAQQLGQDGIDTLVDKLSAHEDAMEQLMGVTN
jgi:hypothetical protein